jgi:hypothetical protein
MQIDSTQLKAPATFLREALGYGWPQSIKTYLLLLQVLKHMYYYYKYKNIFIIITSIKTYLSVARHSGLANHLDA